MISTSLGLLSSVHAQSFFVGAADGCSLAVTAEHVGSRKAYQQKYKNKRGTSRRARIQHLVKFISASHYNSSLAARYHHWCANMLSVLQFDEQLARSQELEHHADSHNIYTHIGRFVYIASRCKWNQRSTSRHCTQITLMFSSTQSCAAGSDPDSSSAQKTSDNWDQYPLKIADAYRSAHAAATAKSSGVAEVTTRGASTNSDPLASVQAIVFSFAVFVLLCLVQNAKNYNVALMRMTVMLLIASEW